MRDTGTRPTLDLLLDEDSERTLISLQNLTQSEPPDAQALPFAARALRRLARAQPKAIPYDLAAIRVFAELAGGLERLNDADKLRPARWN